MPASSVYTPGGAPVNGNIRSRGALALSLSPSGDAVNLATSPLLPASTLAEIAFGRLQDHYGLAVSVLRVLRGLFSHLNPADNYVWPGQKTLADEIGLSRASVERAVVALVGVGALRVVEDADEIAAIERRRPPASRNPGNVYDLTPLARWLPAALFRRAGLPPVGSSLPLSEAERLPPDPFQEDDSGFAPSGAPPCLVIADQSVGGRVDPTPERGSGERVAGDLAPGASASAGAPFLPSKMQARKSEALRGSPAVAALHRVGVWGAVAVEIVEAEGNQWAEDLATYGRVFKGSEPIERLGAWLRGVWEAKRRGDHVWPAWFDRYLERERANAANVLRAPVRSAPGGQKPLFVASAALSGLPEAEKQALERRAEAEISARGPAFRRLVERGGTAARGLVRDQVRRIVAREAQEGGGAPERSGEGSVGGCRDP